MPITYGLFRPVILLPADAREWSAERRRVVLLHELAHVRRKDGATHLLARIALAFYWWHPLVWTAWRQSVKERERAADDIVLNAGAGASEYAGHLLDIARSMQSPRAALAIAQRSQLPDRLAAILDANRNRKAPRRAFAIAASLVAVLVLVPVSVVRAKNEPPQTTAVNSDPATALINQGKAALSAKNYEAAIGFFERAQKDEPQKSAEARMWMAITRQRQDNFETADALYQGALSGGSLAGRWHVVRIEGSRLGCRLRASLDGRALLSETGYCDFSGSNVMLGSNAPAYTPANVAWRALHVFAGSANCR